MTDFTLANPQARTTNKPSPGLGKGLVAVYAQMTMAAALTAADRVRTPQLPIGFTVLDVIVRTPDGTAFDVGTEDDLDRFIAAQAAAAGGGILRSSATTALPYTTAAKEAVVLSPKATTTSTNGVVSITVIGMPRWA